MKKTFSAKPTAAAEQKLPSMSQTMGAKMNSTNNAPKTEEDLMHTLISEVY